MKRFLQVSMLFFLVLVVTTAMAQEKAKIVFEKLEHNFGSFTEAAGVQTYAFKFTNKGATPLILNNVSASCGCTTPKWTREPVAPGAAGEIQVSYDPKNRPGVFTKTVTVYSNAEVATVVLHINGKVEERQKTIEELYPRLVGDLRVVTNHISFASMKQNEVKTEELELLNDTDNPISVGFRTVPGHIKASIAPASIPAKSKGKLIVSYDAKAANVYGFASHRIYLSMNGSNDYKNSVGISATIEEDFSILTPEQLANSPVASFSENSHDFGEMKQGDTKEHTFKLTNNGKTELIIRNIRSSCGCTAVTPSKEVIAPGESVPIKVAFDSRGKRGRQSNSVTVITNDPKAPTATLRVSSNVLTTEG